MEELYTEDYFNSPEKEVERENIEAENQERWNENND